MNSTPDYTKDITILCKVVDNFGDIGFAYRLARSICRQKKDALVRLVVDDLESFSKIAHNVNHKKASQTVEDFFVYDWNVSDVCLKEFSERPPRTILQCFQCTYPEWLENILFEKNCGNDIVQVINIDYLTAESYAEDFHLLNSLTRSARVKKINFMPGFTNKTGGLLLDNVNLDNVNIGDINHQSKTSSLKSETPPTHPCDCNILIFAYEQDFTPLIHALSNFQSNIQTLTNKKNVHTYIAKGNMQKQFLQNWENAKRPFAITPLNFLSQQKWDELLFSMDILFVRGEDSLSRACLSGIPFVWQAYRQEDDYQLVKVQALLQTMQPFFSENHFTILENTWLSYNTTLQTENCTPNFTSSKTSDAMQTFLENAESMRMSFQTFASHLYKNGDFCEHLLQWLEAR